MPELTETQQSIQSIERLVREVENIPDPRVRQLSTELVQSLMTLHGSVFERMLEIVHRSGDAGQRTIDEMGRDELVRSLLLLYGLHPVDLRTRVTQALTKSGAYLRSQGGEIEFCDVNDSGVVTLRTVANSHTCPSSAAHLQSSIEQIIYEAAPDVAGIAFEGGARRDAGTGFVPLADLQPAMKPQNDCSKSSANESGDDKTATHTAAAGSAT